VPCLTPARAAALLFPRMQSLRLATLIRQATSFCRIPSPEPLVQHSAHQGPSPHITFGRSMRRKGADERPRTADLISGYELAVIGSA
jgi:hypothetical protein